MNSKQPEFELHFCYKCFQQTNHIGTTCAKCGQENKTIEPVPGDGAEAKARELVEKFFMELHKGTDVPERIKAAKQCALICVGEIINLCAFGLSETKYWQQVRTHIVAM